MTVGISVALAAVALTASARVRWYPVHSLSLSRFLPGHHYIEAFIPGVKLMTKKTLQPCFFLGELLKKFLCSDSTVLCVSTLSLSHLGGVISNRKLQICKLQHLETHKMSFLCKLINISFSIVFLIYFDYLK